MNQSPRFADVGEVAVSLDENGEVKLACARCGEFVRSRTKPSDLQEFFLRNISHVLRGGKPFWEVSLTEAILGYCCDDCIKKTRPAYRLRNGRSGSTPISERQYNGDHFDSGEW